jgi:hypothetical protein
MYNPRFLAGTTRESIAVTQGKTKAVPSGIRVRATSSVP